MASKNKSQILLVGTGPEVESRLRAGLPASTCRVATAQGGHEAFAAAIQLGADVLVSAVNLPDLSGLELCGRLHPVKPRLRVILLDDQPGVGEQSRSEASRLGVFQLLSEPFDFSELLELTRRAAAANQDELSALEPGEAEFAHTGLIGMSRLMRDLYQQITVAAGSQIPVLLLGETGTGKELVAQAIHRLSPAARHEFVPINCNAIPHSLLEGELFGHEGGAFTGARRRRTGLFERANCGVLFLDEIGELDPRFK